MAEGSIPVDVFNPGQVFACLGFLEAADALLDDAVGGFDWSNESEVRFRICAGGKNNPIKVVLEFLALAEVISIAPACSTQSTEKWKIPTVFLEEDAPFPFPDPPSPATLPAVLRVADKPPLIIDHWGDATGRDNVKFWAGSGGYPGVALALDALNLARDRIISAVDDPFSISAPQSSSFRFDWRRDYIPMDVGFSPNDHEKLGIM